MKTRSISTDQLTLPGLESWRCECGCGTYFMRIMKGNRRRYLNASHKRAAKRAREKAMRADATVRLLPKGYLYINASWKTDLEALWAEFDGPEKALIALLCETGYQPTELRAAFVSLFGKHALPGTLTNPHD